MIEAQVKQNLIQLQSAIRQADGVALGAALAELDRLAAAHKNEIDPQLAHFLQNRSYEKAMAFLGGDQDIPAGVCGGGRR
jgi:hypothetical protein